MHHLALFPFFDEDKETVVDVEFPQILHPSVFRTFDSTILDFCCYY